MSGPILLAFGIWMLLTADFTWPNALVGLAGAIVVSLLPKHRFSAWQLISFILSALIRLPQAVWETCQVVLQPHRHERTTSQRFFQADNPWAVFCQTLIICFTPRSLVISEQKREKVEVHTLERRESE